jgi:hypothetical protein
LPEIWLPYGEVEALFTIQAENLGTNIEIPHTEKLEDQKSIADDALRRAKSVIVADNKPVTMELLASMAPTLQSTESVSVISTSPRKIESALPDLRGRVRAPSLDRTVVFEENGTQVTCPSEIRDQTSKLVLGTAEPDALFGLVDARISLCLSMFDNVRRFAYDQRKSDEPAPFEESGSYQAMNDLLNDGNIDYVTLIPRNGKLREAIINGSFADVKASFYSGSVPPGRGAIIGTGGTGYDDTLSHVLRLVWSGIRAVRKGGAVLLVSECTEGLGSQALELLATGRVSRDKSRQAYADGLEELVYLEKLKKEYEVILLSSLPELYAKSRLGLKIVRSASEGTSKLLEGIGRTGKANIVPRTCELLLT